MCFQLYPTSLRLYKDKPVLKVETPEKEEVAEKEEVEDKEEMEPPAPAKFLAFKFFRPTRPSLPTPWGLGAHCLARWS